MSVKVMGLVFENGPEKPADRLMLLAIADHADDQGVAWPGMERLARKCCVQVRAAQYTIGRLVEEEWIRVTPGGGTRGDVGVPNRFQINMTRLATVQSTAPPNGAVHDTPTVQPTAPEPSLEPSPTPTTVSSSPQVGKRGRMTDSWNPTALNLATAQDAYPNVNVKREVTTFRAWHQSKAAVDRSQAEWDNLFVTWCGRKQEQWDQANPPADQGVRYDEVTGLPVNPKQAQPRAEKRE